MMSFSSSHYRQKIQELSGRLTELASQSMRFMHVCGTHTWNYLRHGLQSLVSPHIELIAGPGCPVCVTAQEDVDWLVALAQEQRVTLVTFGDMMRVPGSQGSLLSVRGRGADVRVILSPLEAVAMAQAEPERRVIVAAVGFETTAPTVAATVESALAAGIGNLSFALLLKRLVPALDVLMEDAVLDGLLCPGHVAAITGGQPFARLAESIGLPCAIAGFEPLDILIGLHTLVMQCNHRLPLCVNTYPRVVTQSGNPAAQRLMKQVFEPCTSTWRGLGALPGTGYALRPGFARYSITRTSGQVTSPTGCLCDAVLLGKKNPADCLRYGQSCTPETPMGPCMVSREGTCAAHYYFNNRDYIAKEGEIRDAGGDR